MASVYCFLDRTWLKYVGGVFLTVLILLGGGVFSPVLSAPPAKMIAGLSPESTRLLKALGIRIVVPGYIPHGYEVESIQVSRLEIKMPGYGPGYRIVYINRQNDTFMIEAVSGGIGGIMGDEEIKVPSSLWGPMILWFYKPSKEMSTPRLRIDWVGEGPFYAFESPARDGDGMISRKEAVKIIQSLRYLP